MPGRSSELQLATWEETQVSWQRYGSLRQTLEEIGEYKSFEPNENYTHVLLPQLKSIWIESSLKLS